MSVTKFVTRPFLSVSLYYFDRRSENSRVGAMSHYRLGSTYAQLQGSMSVISLQETRHQEAILDAKQDLVRIRQAVREWRSKKDLNNCNNLEPVNEKENKTDACQSTNLSWIKGNEFRPLEVSDNVNQPIRKCFSEFLWGNDTGYEQERVSVGDIFQEASLFLARGSSNVNAAANMMRALTPFRAETKHYTTPNQSAMNSPRDNLLWQKEQERTRQMGDEQIPEDETQEGKEAGMTSPHESQGSTATQLKSSRERRGQQYAEEDVDNTGSLPYCHGRCGIVEVLPTIMEVSSATSHGEAVSSFSQRSFASSCSGDSLGPKSALITVKKGARTSALAKCSLCERFGSDSQIIFSIDNMKYTVSRNAGQKKLEPYTGNGGAVVKDKNIVVEDSKVGSANPVKSDNRNSSAGPYNKRLFLPPIFPASINTPDSSSSAFHGRSLGKARSSVPTLPPLLQKALSNRKLRLSDICRADDKKLPPIPSHVVYKKLKKRYQLQKNDIPRPSTTIKTGCKLPPLHMPPDVSENPKQVKRNKYQGYLTPMQESVRNNSRCDETRDIRRKDVTEDGYVINNMADSETIRLLVRVPTMDATTMEGTDLETTVSPRKREPRKSKKHKDNMK